MKQVVAFSLGRKNSFTSSNANPLRFETTISSVGGGVNSNRDAFIAPTSGMYLLSLSIGARTRKPFHVALMRGSTELFHFERTSTAHQGTDIITKSTIVQLTANDRIYIKLWGSNTQIYSDGEFQTSFSGFLYDPKHEAPIAWTVAKNSSLSSTRTETLSYEKIVMNRGNAWNNAENAMVAPLSGYYYIHVSCGALSGKPVHLYVDVNGDHTLDLWRELGYQQGVDLLSRSALLKLGAGDKLQITMASGHALYSNAGLQTSFSGFLVYREA